VWQEKGLNLVLEQMFNENPRMTAMTGIVALPLRTNPHKTPRWNANSEAY